MFTLLDAETGTGPGPVARTDSSHRAFHLYVDGVASPNADVNIEVSNHKDGPWVVEHTFKNLNTAGEADTYAVHAPFKYVRGNITNVSGNGEHITLTMNTES